MKVSFRLAQLFLFLCCLAQAKEGLTDFPSIDVVESDEIKGSYFLYLFSKAELSEVRLLKTSNVSFPLLPKTTDIKNFNVYMPSHFIRLRAGMDLHFVSQAKDNKEIVLHKFRSDEKLKLVLIKVAKIKEGSFDGGLPAEWMPESFLEVGSAVVVDGKQMSPITKQLSGGRSSAELVYESKNPPKKSSPGSEAFAEFNEWRRLSGLPQLREVPEMTAFAQDKANYRAFYHLKDGHQGPQAPHGWREGTGEATSDWGWLTCCQEEDAVEGGAGLTIGPDGERYMVLVVRGGSGHSLLRTGRNNAPVYDTSYLSRSPFRLISGARTHHDVTR